MESGYTITKATPEHLEALSEIELAAATMFDGYVAASVPQDITPQLSASIAKTPLPRALKPQFRKSRVRL